MRWVYLGAWGKCRECWLSYMAGKQHVNSLFCYKVGIPISSLRVPLEDFLELIRNMRLPAKYAVFDPPLSLVSRGVVIVYFNSEEEAVDFIKRINHLVKEPRLVEYLFYRVLVNTEWRGTVNLRRGCPEYDWRFGDWRSWPKPREPHRTR